MKRAWTVLGTLAAGAAALYLANPEHGQRRRAALRRHVTRAARDAVETLEAAGDQAMDRLQPLADEGRQAGRRAGQAAGHRVRDARDRLSERRSAEVPMRTGSGAGRLWLPLLGGMAVGAAALFLLEPQHRSRRWALVRDRAVRLGRAGAEFAGVDPHDLGERARGLATRAATLLQRSPPDDAVLEQRVRGALRRVLSDAQALAITARAGCVSLGGPVPADELARLFECVASVRGVGMVRDEGLEVRSAADKERVQPSLARVGSVQALPPQV